MTSPKQNKYQTLRVDLETSQLLREIADCYGISQIDAASKAVTLLKAQADRDGHITVVYTKNKKGK